MWSALVPPVQETAITCVMSIAFPPHSATAFLQASIASLGASAQYTL